ncbi:hypothetical protein [Nostoc sp. TCL240-02]|nr:hypothetical protein [Nostoc sp. TCL240-02]
MLDDVLNPRPTTALLPVPLIKRMESGKTNTSPAYYPNIKKYIT